MTDQITLEPLAPREAVAFFQSKGLAPALQRFDWRDHWREEHARAFVVAKGMNDDVLNTIRSALSDALTEGQTLDQFRDGLTPKLQQFGWWGRQIERDPLMGELVDVQLGSRHRLRTIFDTNMRTSYAAGKWARIQRTKRAFPYLEYRQIQRETKRHDHERYHGLIRPVDDPIWQVIFPPNGWFCGCSVRPMNRRMLEREGKTVSDPVELEFEERLNARTGVVESVPVGVHSGFDTNPGAVWLDIDRRHRDSALDLPASHLGIDRSWTREIREGGIRDDFESLLTYDLDRPWSDAFDGYTRAGIDQGGRSVMPTRAQFGAMADPTRRIVAIHNHPSSSSFSPADIRTFANMPGLHQLVAVGHDGSIYRMQRTDLTRRIPVELPDQLRIASIRALQASGLDLTDEIEISPLITHLMMTVLQRLGVFDYASAVSGRHSDARTRNAAVLDKAAAAILEAIRR